MSVPHLRLIPGGQPTDDPAASRDGTDDATDDATTEHTAQPRWWRVLVITTLRHGRWIPPLWPLRLVLRLLRSWSIHRAMHAMKGELDWDGNDDFNFIAAFVRVEAKRRADPTFWAACEHALRIGRISIGGGLPVILDDEIDDKGQNAFISHFAWTVSQTRKHPLARRLAP